MQYLGTAFHDLPNVKLYPSVGMKKQPNVHVTVNFGQLPFMFDIDGMVKVCTCGSLDLFLKHI
jgi:Ran-binding protein 9/10